MHTIDLTYAGLGVHEELVAYVADQQNYYQQEGVHVALRDGCAWDGERMRRSATIGLGRAVLARLTDGTPWTVLCVNTDRPLFWLLARDRYASAEELKGRRIGIHPPQTAPGCFSRIVLRRLGLDPDHDIQSAVMTPGDYRRHIRRLAEGTLDAAFVGSTLAPEVTARENRLRLLAFVGDYFQIPTVGVAVDPTEIALSDPAVRALVRANRRALRTIHEEPDLAARYINALIPSLTQTEARQYYERYVAPFFTADGRQDPCVAAQAMSSVAEELGVPTVPEAADIYRTEPAEEPVTEVRARRVYEQAEQPDGRRVLVDRLWPRGLSKDKARLDEWLKAVAPSDELRRWYGHQPARFAEFRHRYEAELTEPERAGALRHLRDAARSGPVTLLTATKDLEHSEAQVLVQLLCSEQ